MNLHYYSGTYVLISLDIALALFGDGKYFTTFLKIADILARIEVTLKSRLGLLLLLIRAGFLVHCCCSLVVLRAEVWEVGRTNYIPKFSLESSCLGGIRSVRGRPPKPLTEAPCASCVGATEPRIVRLTSPCLGGTAVTTTAVCRRRRRLCCCCCCCCCHSILRVLQKLKNC